MTLHFAWRAAIAAALVLPAVASTADTFQHDVLATVEETDLAFTVEDLLANDDAPTGTAISIVQPAHGSVWCEGNACTYRPAAGFTGTDRFAYHLATGGGGAGVDVEVAPLVQPLAGDWNGDQTTDLGWFHGGFQDLFLAELPPGANPFELGPPGCFRPSLPDRRRGWMPIAGDWDGDGRDEIALFDPASREVVLYARAPDGAGWTIAARFAHPGPGRGGLPVAGDWNGDGTDTVGLFLQGEHRFLLLAAHHDEAPWHEVVLTDLADDRRWLPVAADWGGDGSGADVVAVWSPETRVLRIRDDNSTGPTTPLPDFYEEDVDLLPIAGRWGHPESIGFYDPGTGQRSQFVLFPCDFDPQCADGGRQPILLPPPDDPATTSCPAGTG